MEGMPDYVRFLSNLFVVVYMFSVALETTRGQILSTLKDFSLLLRVLLVNLLLVPGLTVLLVSAFNLSPETRIGFLMLGLAPGGLFALQFARIAKGNRVLAVGILFMLSLIAAVGTPLLVELLFPALEAGRPPIVWLILLLVMLVVAPLLAGRVVQMLAPDAALKMSRFLGALSIVIFIVVVLLTSKYKTPAMKSLGGPGIAAIILLTIGSWLAGWLLGGPGANNRKVVAISASMRNVGVCMALATHYFSDPSVAVPLLAFSGVSIPMNMLFAFMVGHAFRHNQTGRAEKAESAGEPGSNPVQVAR